MLKPIISIIGLGKLGSPMVAAFASRGYKVIGLDINPDFVNLINKGKPPVSETNLAEYLKNNREKISATQSYREAVLNSDISFIIVPTPSKNHGGFSTKYVIEVGKNIAKALKQKSKFHLIVLTSTVAPGSTEKDLLSVLEKYSSKKCGIDFGLCYNPEFIALGNVIYDILNPDFILIGASDFKSGNILESFYKSICRNDIPIKKMNFINAEISKIAVNTFITTKISYANMLAEICEEMPSGNVEEVTETINLGRRIITFKNLKSALGYGGPCLPRDNRALVYTAKKFNVNLPIAEATDKINQRQVPRLIKKALSFLPKSGQVSILGLSYKPNTSVIEESQGLKVAKIISEKGILTKVYDPAAMQEAKKYLNKVVFANSLKEAVQFADIILITTPWEEFEKIQLSWLKPKVILIDCWRIIPPKKHKKIKGYMQLGINYKVNH